MDLGKASSLSVQNDDALPRLWAELDRPLVVDHERESLRS